MRKRNILIKLEYKGTNFEGWQIQARGRTVQGVLSDTLTTFLKEEIKPMGAGRTDSGVHALAQYANFKTENPMDCGTILYKLNRMLPDDIAALNCREVPLDFDSRRGAVKREYRYLISESLTAIGRDISWVIGERLDIGMLNKAAGIVRKSSHFHNFCKVKSRKESNICHITKSRWSRYGGFLRYEIAANRFLHNMVRLLVGTMVSFARGKTDIRTFRKQFDINIDDKTKLIAPPGGLFLVGVKYEGIKI